MKMLKKKNKKQEVVKVELATDTIENALRALALAINRFGGCLHDLKPLNYYYDDDWGFKGSQVWGEKREEKILSYCTKCGQVFVVDKKDNKDL